jgi:hypothetical protein
MVIGILLHAQNEKSTFLKYLLAFGLFGFAGGMTNWLAVKMLFDKIPLIYGSGVIPSQFKVFQRAKKVTHIIQLSICAFRPFVRLLKIQ